MGNTSVITDRQIGNMFHENGRFFEKLEPGTILGLTPRIFTSIGITIEPCMWPDGSVDIGRTYSIRSEADGITLKKGMMVMFLKATAIEERDEWAVEVLHDNRICMFWAADAKMEVVTSKSGT